MGIPGRIWRPGRVFNGSAVLIRIDWLGGMETDFGKVVLGVTLKFEVLLASCPGWQGLTGEDGGAQRTAWMGWIEEGIGEGEFRQRKI